MRVEIEFWSQFIEAYQMLRDVCTASNATHEQRRSFELFAERNKRALAEAMQINRRWHAEVRADRREAAMAARADEERRLVDDERTEQEEACCSD